MKPAFIKRNFALAFLMLQPVFLVGCSAKTVTVSPAAPTPPVAYCSSVSTFSSPTITVSGTAYYAYRINGNGEVADGGFRYRPTAAISAGLSYSITLNTTKTYSVTAVSGETEQSLSQKLAALINNDSSSPATASQLFLNVSGGQYWTLVNAKNYGVSITAHSAGATMTEVARTAPNPIRYAEIMVKDSSGKTIQCGQTTNTGTYSLTLPQGSSNYNVYVNSRVLDANVTRAYVLDYHQTNNHYSVSANVSASANSSSNNMLASGVGTLEGGAFNILDDIVKTSEFLRQFVSSTYGCGTTITACSPFVTPSLVYVYWKPGVNPYTYFGSSSPSSFYIGNSKLYILGGSNGDVDNSDTDHFDNSVVIHEYGHFLEDTFAGNHSPGGFHDGNSIVDPRLAWSEGWSDFIQGAVTGINFYRDTKGNSSGTLSSTVIINENIDTTAWDVPSGGSEGMFHEFSITRLLWDAIDPHPVTGAGTNEAGDDVGTFNSMSEIWTVFAGANGLKADTPFRHIGTFHKLQDVLVGRTSWATLRNSEKQNGNAAYNGIGFREYATPLVVGSNCSLTLAPVFVSGDSGDFSTSDQYKNNDFISYYHSGGPLTVQLTYSTTVFNDPPDLDLYVYDADYTYGSTATMIGRSENARPTGCVANHANCTNLTETVSATAPAGYYMINVKAFTGDGAIGGAATYSLTINGQQSCPTP